MAQTKQDTTILSIQFSGGGSSYENPFVETLEHFMERKGLKTKQEAIDNMNAWGGDYFIGTQTEYDKINEVHTVYYELDGIAQKVWWRQINYLKDGAIGAVPTLKDLVTFDNTKEITKSEYDILKVKNDADSLLSSKVSNLKYSSSHKLAAYISKCEDYIAEHVDDVKAPQLKSFILPNGKIDNTALETTIKDNQVKTDSIALLCEAYLSWINLIETGTQASLDQLPETDPVKLNAIIDTLWKAEHDKERKSLIAKLNSSEAEFAIVDKYLTVSQGDEPEIK